MPSLLLRLTTAFGLIGLSVVPLFPVRAAEDSGPGPLSVRGVEAADRVRNKVVVVRTARGNSHGYAAGFLAAPGLVLTAGHVVDGVSTAVTWVNGVAYPATVVGTHPELDVALLRLRAPELLLKPVTLARSTTDLRAEDELVVVPGPSQPAAASDPANRRAHPARFQSRITQRSVQGKPGPALALRGATDRGDSGSPVVRASDGAVVGMVVGRELADAEGVSRVAYAVPVDALQSWLSAEARRPAVDPPAEEFYLSGIVRKAR